MLSQQHKQSLYQLIPMHKYFPAYGILLLTTPLSFLNKDFRETILKNREGRMILCWACAVGLLILNDKFLPGVGFQPPHFTRGYLFSALVMLSGLGLFPAFRKIHQKGGGKAAMFIILFLTLILPDNILFTVERFTEPPHPLVLSIPPESRDALDFIKNLPDMENVFCPDRKFGYLIPAFTPHSSIFSELYVTVDNENKVREIQYFFSGQDKNSFIEKHRITIIILPHYGNLIRLFEERVKTPDCPMIYDNRMWRIYKINK
jgi:hypothetical protein